MEKQRRHNWDTRRPKYAVYRRRRRIGLSVLVLLAVLALGGLGAYLSAGSSEEETGDGPSEQVAAPVDEEQAPEETGTEKEAAEDEEAETAAAAPADPTLYLTVPRLEVYGHTVRNDRSEAALDLGAIKLPNTGFPWQKEYTNTYIACHRLGWPGTESYNQCLNLPSIQKGDEVILTDANGAVYRYLVSELLTVGPNDSWVTRPVEGRDVVSLQTCIEAPGDFFTLGPSWTARFIVRADRLG
ncbi:MAG: class E sortase [Actinomycetota bacterium]|nr:class E sortase [Actinomycetota bacterium]